MPAETIQSEIDEYSLHPRDSRRERELLCRLRAMPEEARFNIVRRLLLQNKQMGLLMASGALQQPRYFEEILEMGLKVGNASTILPWLECAVPKLGFRRVVSSLSSRIETEPEAVANAVYWMPRFKPQNDPKAEQAWDNLKARQVNAERERVEPAWAGPATACRE